MNDVLAQHYGMSNVHAGPDEWVHVADARQYGRGGQAGQYGRGGQVTPPNGAAHAPGASGQPGQPRNFVRTPGQPNGAARTQGQPGQGQAAQTNGAKQPKAPKPQRARPEERKPGEREK